MWISSQIWGRKKHTKLDQSTIRLKTNPFGQNNREAPQKGSWPSYHRDFQVKIQRCLPSIRKYYICLRKGNYLDIFRYSTVVQELVLSNPVLDILIDIYVHTNVHQPTLLKADVSSQFCLWLPNRICHAASYRKSSLEQHWMEYRFEGHAHCFHMLSRTFSSRKILMIPSMVPQLYGVEE